MKNTFLPFKIGEQYENWEFDLEYSKEERIKGCDSYMYLWKKPFLHIIPTEIELIFSLDILQVVIMTCEFQTLENLHQFRVVLEEIFGSSEKFKNENLDADICKNQNIEIWLVYIPLGYRVNVVYGSPNNIRKIYN